MQSVSGSTTLVQRVVGLMRRLCEPAANCRQPFSNWFHRKVSFVFVFPSVCVCRPRPVYAPRLCVFPPVQKKNTATQKKFIRPHFQHTKTAKSVRGFFFQEFPPPAQNVHEFVQCPNSGNEAKEDEEKKQKQKSRRKKEKTKKRKKKRKKKKKDKTKERRKKKQETNNKYNIKQANK